MHQTSVYMCAHAYKNMENTTLVLQTHYGVVRYLYLEIFKQHKNETNDLQSQTLFLKCLNKYMLCNSGQYAHLYSLYANISREAIHDYYQKNRMRMNLTAYEWLNYSTLVNAPRILPNIIDGPYIVDSLSLRTYTQFWTPKYLIKSNIIATPFYCLDGIDHLYYEMVKWRSACESFKITLNVSEKHVYHDTFYMVEMSTATIEPMHFLLWLDDVQIQTELYVINDGDATANQVVDGTTGGHELCLLKRLYLACDNNLFIQQLSAANTSIESTEPHPFVRVLNLLMNNLSEDFVVTFTGKPPKMTKTAILNLTNDSPCTDGQLNFTAISQFGFNPNITDQIYEIENMSELNISAIHTPNVLIFQEDQGHPTANSCRNE